MTFGLRATSRYEHDFHKREDLTRDSASPTSRWVQATVRPDRPQVAFIVPLFQTGREQRGSEILQRRQGGWFRVWLERPWFSSGEGELLALVCWPGDLFKPRGSSSEYLADKLRQKWGTLTGQNNQPPPELARLFTGWGLDPIWDQGMARLDLIPPGGFENRLNTGLTQVVPSQLLNGIAPDAEVALALYEPKYDEEEHRWYSDIHIKCDDTAYFPFVRLGLARYQPNAIERCKLSEIVTSEFIQLAPDRGATVRVERKQHAASSRIKVTVVGAQTWGPAVPPTSDSSPKLVIRIDEGVRDTYSEELCAWVPVRDVSGMEEIDAQRDNKRQLWEVDMHFNLARERTYSVYLEEREPITVDEFPDTAREYRGALTYRITYADRILLPKVT